MDNAHKASEKQKKDGRAGRFEALQKELWARLGPTNTLILLAAHWNARRLLSVLLKNGSDGSVRFPSPLGSGFQPIALLPAHPWSGPHPPPGSKGIRGRYPGPHSRHAPRLVQDACPVVPDVHGKPGHDGDAHGRIRRQRRIGGPAVQGSVRPLRPKLPSIFRLDTAQARAHRLRGHRVAGRHVYAPLAAIVFAVEVIMIDLTTARPSCRCSSPPCRPCSPPPCSSTPKSFMQAGRSLPGWGRNGPGVHPVRGALRLASVWFSEV